MPGERPLLSCLRANRTVRCQSRRKYAISASDSRFCLGCELPTRRFTSPAPPPQLPHPCHDGTLPTAAFRRVSSLVDMAARNLMLACALALVAGASAFVLTPETTAAPVVKTAGGMVSGFVDDTINTYYGIPFAQPPVGNLRFAPPVPANPWSGVLNGSATPPVCAQISIGHKDVMG